MANEFSAAEFDELLHRVEVKFGEAQQQARILTDRAISAVRWMGPLGDEVVRLLETMWEWIKKAWDEIKKFFTQPGVPWTLWSHGSTWAGPTVAGRISQLVSSSTLDGVRSDNYWQGPAAEAYRDTLPRQKEALDALVKAAQGVDDALSSMAAAIIAFWLAVLTAITAWVAEEIAAAGAAATGVGAPPAAAAGGISAAKVLGLISLAATLLHAFIIRDVLPDIKNLEQSLHDRSAFGEKWPPSDNFDLSDGSLSDGDATNWRIKS